MNLRAVLPTLVLGPSLFIGICVPTANARSVPPEPKVLADSAVHKPTHFDTSQPLSSLTAAPRAGLSTANFAVMAHTPKLPKLPRLAALPVAAIAPAALPSAVVRATTSAATVGLSFAGVGNTSTLSCPGVVGFSVVPPDTNAAVGDTQVVQWVNVCYAVFDKATGALIAGPFAGTDFWKGFGGGCEADNDGDIIIKWDKANHRWLASQNDFGPNSSGPYQTCIAVSKTADATGPYYRYSYPQPGFPDYPKWGLQPRAYFQTQNNFGALGLTYVGVTLCAYDGAAMRRGRSNARQICMFDDDIFDDNMLPADDDSVAEEEGGGASTEVLLGSIDNYLPGDSHVYEYVFSVNFDQPSSPSTLTGVNGSIPIDVPAFNLAIACCYTTYAVPQPGIGSELLDTLGDRLMYRLARFTRDGTQHFTVNHSVNDSTAVGVRWYDFEAVGSRSTALTLHQTGQTPDDGEYRWMGSIARDKAGDLALGYSRSSAQPGDYPALYFSGQKAGEPLGTTDVEVLIKRGGGSQFDSFNRWGDYSSMALDGVDSCTFWYTNEYYPADGSLVWATWLASLKFPRCGKDD